MTQINCVSCGKSINVTDGAVEGTPNGEVRCWECDSVRVKTKRVRTRANALGITKKTVYEVDGEEFDSWSQAVTFLSQRGFREYLRDYIRTYNCINDGHDELTAMINTFLSDWHVPTKRKKPEPTNNKTPPAQGDLK